MIAVVHLFKILKDDPVKVLHWKVKENVSCSVMSNCLQPYGPGSSVHGIFQASVVEWVAIDFSDGCKSWTLKKAECGRIDAFELVVLDKNLESPLDCKKIQPVHPKGNHWKSLNIPKGIFIGRTDTEAEALMLWPPDVKSWLVGKDPDAGKDWRQKKKRAAEDEMVGWHHQLNER